MKLKDLVNIILNAQKESKSSEAFVCGGLPRDKFLNNIKNIDDIDITTGDATVHYLAENVYRELKKQYNIQKKTSQDGHLSIKFGNMKIDFSSNYINENVNHSMSLLEQETWSRDFTCNSLLLPLDFSKIIDLTNMGIKDINNKVLRTCLNPEITFPAQNFKRLARVIYMCAKLNFHLSDEIKKYITNNKHLFQEIPLDYFEKKTDKAFEINPKLCTSLVDEMGLWKHIPITKNVEPYFKSRKV